MVPIRPKTYQSETVQVIVRCRPMNQKEITEKYERVVAMFPDKGVVELTDPKNNTVEAVKSFTFDAVYDWNSKQQELYDETFRPLVDSVLNGFNGTIFAYGQTGTGKTYTMEGVGSVGESRGVIPNSFHHIFNHIARSKDQQYLVRTSYLEIYQEEIRDLLSKDQSHHFELKERPDVGVYVKDLSSFMCKSEKEIEHVMSIGNHNRTTGATDMNEQSSRSHAIFLVTVECSDLSLEGENHIRVGKLNLVDLAGSERQNKTGASGERLKEATKINLSLSALGNVISALVDGKSTHIPYRDSKLTRLLQDSLGGNAKTVMVANIGPASYNYAETLTTLRYANRAKNIKNKPRINEDPKDALLREFQVEIAKLKASLAQRGKRKKKSRNKAAVEGSDDDVEVSEEYLKDQKSGLEEQKNKILNDKNMLKGEKDALMSSLQFKVEELEKEREAQKKVEQKVKAMESKLLSGGKNIIDHTNEQQRTLEIQRQQLLEQKRKEREMQQRLDLEEESTGELLETFTSLQQEVEVKTKKLKKMNFKLAQIKQEVADAIDEYNIDRRELELTQINLTRELKLKQLIMDNFIPSSEKQKVLSRLKFDDEEDKWKWISLPSHHPPPITSRPVSASGQRRPVSDTARTNAYLHGYNLRSKGENVMNLTLDPPKRTTFDYPYSDLSGRLLEALDDALQPVEEDIDIDASVAVLVSNTRVTGTRKEKSKSKGSGASDVFYPQARGLVLQ